MEVVNSELQEQHSYFRYVLDQYLKAFALFMGFNLIGYGWFISQLGAKSSSSIPLWLICTISVYAIMQNTLGIVVSLYVYKFIASTRKRMSKLVEYINSEAASSLFKSETPCPLDLFKWVIRICIAALGGNILLWVIIALRLR